MNILITQHRLLRQGGTEQYAFDLARSLIHLGHRVVVYSPRLGEFSKKFLDATISVVDDLSEMQHAPDIIHGHHGMETLTAMVRFPESPAVYVMHDWSWEFDCPPQLSRVMKYIAVDETCLERLTLRIGTPVERTMVLQNGVDLVKFWKRPSLPEAPKRALVFNDHASSANLNVIRGACESQGISLDAVGANLEATINSPESLLPQYDLVFASGRCAREALAVGCSVIVCSENKSGSLVTARNVEQYGRSNFGRRLLVHNHSEGRFIHEIQKFDSNDAALASNFVRENSSLSTLVESLLTVYRQAINEFKSDQSFWTTQASLEEARQMSAFISSWSREVVVCEPDRELVRDQLKLRNAQAA